MIEATISRHKKINRGNYESEEIMCAVKAQVLDNKDVPELLEAIDSQVKEFIDKKEKEIKEGKQ